MVMFHLWKWVITANRNWNCSKWKLITNHGHWYCVNWALSPLHWTPTSQGEPRFLSDQNNLKTTLPWTETQTLCYKHLYQSCHPSVSVMTQMGWPTQGRMFGYVTQQEGWRQTLTCERYWCQPWWWWGSLQPPQSGYEPSTCREEHKQIAPWVIYYIRLLHREQTFIVNKLKHLKPTRKVSLDLFNPYSTVPNSCYPFSFQWVRLSCNLKKWPGSNFQTFWRTFKVFLWTMAALSSSFSPVPYLEEGFYVVKLHMPYKSCGLEGAQPWTSSKKSK